MADLDEQRVVEAYPALRRFAFVIADSDTDPDDLLHESLVRTLSLSSLAEVDDLMGYVRKVMTNVASNNRRSLGRRRRAIDRLQAESSAGVDIGLDAPSDLAALMLLEPSDRAALYLFVVEGRPHREVAELLGVTEVAARARVSRALKRLRVEEAEEVGHADNR